MPSEKVFRRGNAPTNQTNAAAPARKRHRDRGAGAKGYVWMNEVNKNIFDATYEDIVAYFGVEGEFVKKSTATT